MILNKSRIVGNRLLVRINQVVGDGGGVGARWLGGRYLQIEVKGFAEVAVSGLGRRRRHNYHGRAGFVVVPEGRVLRCKYCRVSE